MALVIYGYEVNARIRAIEIIARYEGVQLDLVEANPFTNTFPEGYEKLNFNKRIPTLKDGDFVLFETIPIISYIARANKSKILGHGEKDRALVLQWACWVNQELSSTVTPWLLNYAGVKPFNKKEVDNASKNTQAHFTALDRVMVDRNFLVGSNITAADILVTSFVHRTWSSVAGPSIRDKFPNLSRLVNTIMKEKNYGPHEELINEAPKVPKACEKKEKESG